MSLTIIRCKITDVTGIWYASGVQMQATPEKHIAFLNKTAQRKGVNATYELATESDYRAYKLRLRAEINSSKESRDVSSTPKEAA